MGMTLKELLTKGEGTISAKEAKALAAQCRMDVETLYTLLEERGIKIIEDEADADVNLDVDSIIAEVENAENNNDDLGITEDEDEQSEENPADLKAAMDELLDFATPEERLDRIEDFIDRLLTLNPKITQGEIYDKIRKQRAYIKKGVIYFDGQTRPLKPFMAEAIDRNNRIAWVEKFSPVSEAERDLLCQIFKVNRPDLVALSSEKPTSRMDAVLRLQEIFNEEADTSVRSRLYAEGFIIRENGGSTYAINFKRHILINLTEEGFDLDRLKRKSSKKQTNKVPVRNAARPHSHHVKLRDAGGGSQSEKREWEVGHKGNYDEIDDGRSLKR